MDDSEVLFPAVPGEEEYSYFLMLPHLLTVPRVPTSDVQPGSSPPPAASPATVS